MYLYNNLPKTILSPISGDVLELKDNSSHNDAPLDVAQFLGDSTEFYDGHVAMYRNDQTSECLYIPYDE